MFGSGLVQFWDLDGVFVYLEYCFLSAEAKLTYSSHAVLCS